MPWQQTNKQKIKSERISVKTRHLGGDGEPGGQCSDRGRSGRLVEFRRSEGRPGQFMPWLVQIQKSNSVHLWKPSPQNQSVELIRGKFVQCFTGVIFSFFCLFFLFVWFQFENKMPQTLHTYIIYIYIDIYIAINIYHRDFQLKIIRWWEKVIEPLNSGHIRPESRVWVQFETTLLEAFLLI